MEHVFHEPFFFHFSENLKRLISYWTEEIEFGPAARVYT
jgi:hypothetical protein